MQPACRDPRTSWQAGGDCAAARLRLVAAPFLAGSMFLASVADGKSAFQCSFACRVGPSPVLCPLPRIAGKFLEPGGSAPTIEPCFSHLTGQSSSPVALKTAHFLIASVTILSVDITKFSGGECSAVTPSLCPAVASLAT